MLHFLVRVYFTFSFFLYFLTASYVGTMTRDEMKKRKKITGLFLAVEDASWKKKKEER